MNPYENHGLVGESGCSKTVTSLSILRLITHPGLISGGELIWNGNDLLKLKKQTDEVIEYVLSE